MDYEKKYNEALERAKKVKHDIENIGCSMAPDMLEVIFPELREIEEETTRKELLDFVRSFWTDHKEKLPQVSRWVTYLEKQKEQKPAEWSKQQVVNALTSMLNERITPFHQKSLDGTIGDKEKMFMDALVEMRSFINSPSFDIGKENSAEWSEEDEDNRLAINKAIWEYDEFSQGDAIKLINWLKSLHPSWKPSEEQMRALNKVVNGEVLLTTQHESLESLYEQLKKLM